MNETLQSAPIESDLSAGLNRLIAIRNRIYSASEHASSQANRLYGVEPESASNDTAKAHEPVGKVAEITQVLGEIDRALDRLVAQQDRLSSLG